MPATPHRVLGSGKTARHSIGYFLEPGFRTEVMTPDAAKPRTYANHLIGEFPGRFEPPGDNQET